MTKGEATKSTKCSQTRQVNKQEYVKDAREDESSQEKGVASVRRVVSLATGRKEERRWPH